MLMQTIKIYFKRAPFYNALIGTEAVNRDRGGQNMLEVCIRWLIEPIDGENPHHVES
jgi:hypothetical protein